MRDCERKLYVWDLGVLCGSLALKAFRSFFVLRALGKGGVLVYDPSRWAHLPCLL
jgi:hypothetical protein